MKKALMLILNGLSVIPFLVLYKHGANVGLYMFPVWCIITVVNTVFSEKPSQLWGYNGFMLLFSLIGIFANIYLYINFVYWDSVGGMVAFLEAAITVFYIAILTLVEHLVKFKIIGVKAETQEENINSFINKYDDVFK